MSEILTIQQPALEWQNLPDAARSLIIAMQAQRQIGLADLSNRAIPNTHIATLLEAAQYVPLESRSPPWRFMVFTNQGRALLGTAFAESYAQQIPNHLLKSNAFIIQYEVQLAKVWRAPVWIVVVFTPTMHPSPSIPQQQALTRRAVGQIQLLATGLGLHSAYCDCHPEQHNLMAGMLGVEPHEQLLGYLYLGQLEQELLGQPEVKQRITWHGAIA